MSPHTSSTTYAVTQNGPQTSVPGAAESWTRPPPSNTMVWPVIHVALAANHTAASPMSDASPSRCSGSPAATSAPRSPSQRIRAKSVLIETRRDAVHANAWTELGAELLGEVDERRLEHAVHAELARRLVGPLGGDVDDHPAVVLHVPAPGHLRPQQRPAQVDLVGLVEAGRVDADRGSGVRVRRGVVHQDVHGAEPIERRIDARLGILRPPDMTGVPGDLAPGGGPSDLRRCRFEPVRLARDEHHRGAGSSTGLGDPQSDAPRPARDDGDLSVQPRLHWRGAY